MLDADHHGADLKGLAVRAALFGSALPHLSLAVFAIGLIVHWDASGVGASAAGWFALNGHHQHACGAEGGTAGQMAATSAEAAIVQAFTPLCVARAEQQPEQLALLKEESSWERDNFVVEAGWVANVNETYRAEVADACASAVLEAMEAAPAAPAAPAN